MNLETQNPLMLPIQFEEQVYFTSHYFHSQYKNNAGEKYTQLKNFNALIRSIETYQDYVSRKDIVELTWQEAKNSTDFNFKPVYESTAYKPIMLINATAQLALSHHLDDAISKTISVEVNSKASTKAPSAKLLFSESKALIDLAKLFGLEGNQAVLSASKAAKKMYGYSPLELLEVELISPVKEKTLTPTEIGLQLGGLSGQKINKLLEELGYQTNFRDSHENIVWSPTEKGKSHGEMIDTAKKHNDGTPVKQWKWYASIIDLLDA